MLRLVAASFALLLSSAASLPAHATTWELDPDHSEIGFLVKHMMVSNVRGAFHQVTGVAEVDDKDVTKSTVTITINTASLDTHTQKRDDHLRSPDFLDAAKFPTITFKSTKVAKRGKGLAVTGDLTIRDVTKSVTLTVDGPTKAIKDPFGMTRAGAAASAKIHRKDYGLTWNKVIEGGALVGDDVTIEVSAEFIKKEAPKP